MLPGASVSAAESSSRKPVRGSFTARAVPAAQYVATGCEDAVSENLSQMVFKAPGDGLFEATMDGFRGDWDIWVVDEKGEYLAGSWNIQGWVGEQPGERVAAPLERGDKITMFVCNFDGQPEVVVDYVFRFLDLENLLAGDTLLEERVPVNFVFVGYDRRQVDARTFRKGLPKEYRPIIRSRNWYGRREMLGIRYGFDYDFVFSNQRYEDRVFSKLRGLGQPTTPTLYQRNYNTQAGASRAIDKSLAIPALDFERWLAGNAPRGVDTSE